jgi:ankyrin repeat protein
MIASQTENGTHKRIGWSTASVSWACWVVLCLFLTLGAKSPAPGGEIQKAVFKGDFNRVVALLKDHPELVENKDSLGQTPLIVAVNHNKPEIMELLLANGADVNARDAKGHTPLILAMWVYNHDKMVRLLLAKGADVNLEDRWKMTALAYAVQEARIADAKILIANDANINVVSGSSPLFFAVFGMHREMVELLLENGADVNYRMGGWTALSWAKAGSDPKIEALLIKYGGHE